MKRASFCFRLATMILLLVIFALSIGQAQEYCLQCVIQANPVERRIPKENDRDKEITRKQRQLSEKIDGTVGKQEKQDLEAKILPTEAERIWPTKRRNFFHSYLLIQSEDSKEARRAVKQNIGKLPKSILGHALHAYWARTIDRPSYALAYGNLGLDACGPQPLLHLEIAASHYLLSNFKTARIYLRKIFMKSPRTTVIFFYALYLDGLLYLKEGNLNYALFRFKESLQNPPPSYQGLFFVYANLGIAHHRLATRQKRETTAFYQNHQEEAKKFYQYALSIVSALKKMKSEKSVISLSPHTRSISRWTLMLKIEKQLQRNVQIMADE